jgi:hypothetical protein
MLSYPKGRKEIQVAFATIIPEHTVDGETGCRCQLKHFVDIYQMAIAQAVAATFPVQEEVIGFHLIGLEADGLPGYDLSP